MGLCHDTAWARQLGRRRGRWGVGVGAGSAGGRTGCRRARRALGALACWASGCRRAGRRAAGGARGRLGEPQQARGERQQARGAHSRRADMAWTRGGARKAQAGARVAAGWAACARLVCAAGPSWVFWCT